MVQFPRAATPSSTAIAKTSWTPHRTPSSGWRLAETTREVGVFVHVFSGDVDAEDVGTPAAGPVATPAALRSGAVTIAPDVLTWIRVE